MSRRRRYDYELSRPGAILAAVFALLVSCAIGISSLLTSIPIERSEAVKETVSFDCYEFNYHTYHFRTTLRSIKLFFDNGEYSFIGRGCIDETLKKKIAKLEKGEQLHILKRANSNFLLELKTDSAEILNFDFAQDKILEQCITNLGISAIFFLFFCCFVYKAITAKDKGITSREDLKLELEVIKEMWEDARDYRKKQKKNKPINKK